MGVEGIEGVHFVRIEVSGLNGEGKPRVVMLRPLQAPVVDPMPSGLGVLDWGRQCLTGDSALVSSLLPLMPFLFL